MNEPIEMPTPRTDAQSKVYRYRSLGSGLVYNHPEAAGDCEALVYVSESFAKQLERDLSTLRKAAEAARVKAEALIHAVWSVQDWNGTHVGETCEELGEAITELCRATAAPIHPSTDPAQSGHRPTSSNHERAERDADA